MTTRSTFSDEELRVMLGALAHARRPFGGVGHRMSHPPKRNDFSGDEPIQDDAEPRWLLDYQRERRADLAWTAGGLVVGLLIAAAALVLLGMVKP